MESALATLSLIGAAVFAISGAIVAAEERLDIVGALFLSVATAIGGGAIVDVLIGHQPVRFIEQPMPLAIAAGAGVIAFLALRPGKRTHALLIWADAIGLSVFTATGMERLSAYGLDPVATIFLTAIGASGGGILRDVLANRTPIVFSPDTELYVTASFAGSGAFLAANALTEAPQAPLIAALIVTALVRAAGIVFDIRLGGLRRT